MKPCRFIVHFKEVLRIEAATDVIREGQMMSEGAFLQHCQGPDGALACIVMFATARIVFAFGMRQFGYMTPEQSKAKFTELAQEESAVTDFDGPNGEFQVRVGLRKLVNFRDSEVKAKELEASRKKLKNPNEEQQAKLELEARTNLETVLGSKRTAGMCLTETLGKKSRKKTSAQPLRKLATSAQEIAKVSSGSASAWDDAQLAMGGTVRQQMEPILQDDAVADDDNSDHGSEDPDDNAEPESKKRKSWWDRDRAVTATLRKEILRKTLNDISHLLFSLVFVQALDTQPTPCTRMLKSVFQCHGIVVCMFLVSTFEKESASIEKLRNDFIAVVAANDELVKKIKASKDTQMLVDSKFSNEF
eukprot:6480128-Amphidinium_carterae.5